jgi:recombination protein RecT
MSKAMTLRDKLNNPAQLQEIARALPAHMSADRMARVTLTAMTRTPKLAECEPASFFQCLMSLSQWGLEPDGRHAHLIPFDNTKKRITECQLIVDYKGLVQLAMRTGNIASIHCDAVCENDDFDYDCGEVLRHKIDFRKPRGEAYAFVCIIRMKDGGKKCEVMTRFEVDSIRDRSAGYRAAVKYNKTDTPWITDYNEMAKKTVFRRASKWIELSSEIRDAFDHDDKDYVDGRVTARQTAPVTTADDLTQMLAKPQQAAIAEASNAEAVDWQSRLDHSMTQRQLEELRQAIEADADWDSPQIQQIVGEIDERLSVVMAE